MTKVGAIQFTTEGLPPTCQRCGTPIWGQADRCPNCDEPRAEEGAGKEDD